MTQVFICYSRTDTEKLEQLVKLLETTFNQKHKFWYDKNLVLTEEFLKRISTEIRQSKVFIFLGSKESIASDYCFNEYNEAIRQNKKILPVFLENPKTCLEKAHLSIKHSIEKTNYLELSNPIELKEFAKLCGSLEKLLEPRLPWRLIAAIALILALVIAGLAYRVATINTDPTLNITENNSSMVKGSLAPDFLCSDVFRIVVYVKTDKWYIQPNDQGTAINTDTCQWETPLIGERQNQVSQIAVQVAPKAERYPASIPAAAACPPLNVDEPTALVWSCFTP